MDSMPTTELQATALEAPKPQRLSWAQGLGLVGATALSFHISYAVPSLSCLVVVYAYCLTALSGLPTARACFRYGFLAGLLTFGPQLFWFWQIFGPTAICLWAVLSFFSGCYVFFVRRGQATFPRLLWLIAPITWTALEFFRGELYYLRFPWLSAGFVFSHKIGRTPLEILGIYGTGFFIFLIAAGAFVLPRGRNLIALGSAAVLIALLVHLPAPKAPSDLRTVTVAGIQLEFPPELALSEYLDRALAAHPSAEIVVLSEYTLAGPVPKRLREWCRRNGRYLIVGGKDESHHANEFYNMAFVVGPSGEVVFKQAKSVPIQFFKDGLPADSQNLWNSPWGKIGICVCYDLSYRTVIDNYVRQGAQAMIVPFMDITDWGRHQHQLHARIAPVRAREYRIPIFRLGSSGISQNVDSTGRILAEAPFPGQEQILAGELRLSSKSRLPLDAWLAPGCALLLTAFLAFQAVRAVYNWTRHGRRGRKG
jgi:apolipoprotein N-acyltransferase